MEKPETAGVHLQWMQKRLSLKPELVNLLTKTDFDCYETFLDLENPSDLQKLFEEAKESPDEWPTLFNADKSNFSHGALRKLTKIPLIAKTMGETFFNAIVNGAPIDDSISESMSVGEMETNVKQPLSGKKFEPHSNAANRSGHHLTEEDHDGHYLSEINKEALLARLKSSIERAYTTVTDMAINTETLEVAIEVAGDNTIIPTHKCLVCRMVLKIGYGARKGKFKQYFTGNMKKHLVKKHFAKREFMDVPEDTSV